MRETLRAAGARPAGAVLEQNAYFDTPDGQLQNSDRGLRIRINETPAGRRTVVLTHKGPRRGGELKVRPEAEVAVESFESAAALLESMGFQRRLSFQKKRESYRLGAARVVLDELPQLGFFLEIEADDEDAVHQARRRLGLADETPLTAPYVALVAEHLAKPPRPGDELKF